MVISLIAEEAFNKIYCQLTLVGHICNPSNLGG
jgi:hypothetical protein